MSIEKNGKDMNRCLWVVPKAIFPVRDGARVANQALLKSVRPHFHQLDLMLFNEKDSDEYFLPDYYREFGATNVYFFKRASFSSILKKLLFLGKNFLKNPHLPVTTGYFHTGELKREIKNVLADQHYDLVVFDGLHPYAAFAELPIFSNAQLVYRAHNVEGDLWSTAANKTKIPLIKHLLLWQGRKMADLEKKIIARAKKVWCISPDDLNRFKELEVGHDHKLCMIPVGMNFKKMTGVQIETRSPIKLLFLGKMDWAPNRDGLQWFLQEVWPAIDHDKFELHIVGSGDSSWGRELFQSPGIKFHGFVKDLDAIYRNCDFSIIPIRYGSGTRIKVIESISKGVPVISTEMGVQGSGLRDYLKAETALDWIETIKGLDRDQGKMLAETAFVQMESTYSPLSIGEQAFRSIAH